MTQTSDTAGGRVDGEALPGDRVGVGTQQDISPVALLNVALRHRRLIVSAGLGFFVLTVAYGFLRPARFVAEASFYPQMPAQAGSGLAGVAAQFGLNVAGTGAATSVDFYADLVKSPEILRAAVLTSYRLPWRRDAGETSSANLVELYHAKGRSEEGRTRRAMSRLGASVSVHTSVKTGTVGLAVVSPWPDLCEQIARRLLDLVNEFNVRTLQSIAGAERRFTAGRAVDAKDSLGAAEERLEEFYRQNRGFENSPRLAVESARLQRQIDLRQQVYVMLVQRLEQARIDEVRNTPLITVVDPPERTARPAGLSFFRLEVMGLATGILLGLGFAFGQEYLDRDRRRKPGEFRELGVLLVAFKADLSRVTQQARRRLTAWGGNIGRSP